MFHTPPPLPQQPSYRQGAQAREKPPGQGAGLSPALLTAGTQPQRMPPAPHGPASHCPAQSGPVRARTAPLCPAPLGPTGAAHAARRRRRLRLRGGSPRPSSSPSCPPPRAESTGPAASSAPSPSPSLSLPSRPRCQGRSRPPGPAVSLPRRSWAKGWGKVWGGRRRGRRGGRSPGPGVCGSPPPLPARSHASPALPRPRGVFSPRNFAWSRSGRLLSSAWLYSFSF